MNQLQATLPARSGPASLSTTAQTDMRGRADATSPQVYAKVAGVIWLIVAILAPFAEFFVRQGLIVPGNVAATGDNIVASQSLFRAGFATDLVVFVIEVALAAVLYVLFRPVNRTLRARHGVCSARNGHNPWPEPAQHVYRAPASDQPTVRNRL